eukprot:2214336-Rhodomonas_salina.2
MERPRAFPRTSALHTGPIRRGTPQEHPTWGGICGSGWLFVGAETDLIVEVLAGLGVVGEVRREIDEDVAVLDLRSQTQTKRKRKDTTHTSATSV